jgi:beta-aspartyl-peptidase (threonine type)
MRASGFVLLVAALGSAPAACRIEGGAPVAGTDTIPGVETQVARMLERSAEAWNRGDLDGFMDDYLRSPTTSYIGSSGRVAGWEAIRARYAPLFQAGALRDSLRFEGIAARPLGDDHALATARYVLFREGSVTGSGPFTLVLWRTDEGWRIVHDQSASDPPAEEETEGPAAEEDSTSRAYGPPG